VGGPEGTRRKSAAVIANGQDDALVDPLEAELNFARVGVPGDVRERLLSNAVDDQLLLLR